VCICCGLDYYRFRYKEDYELFKLYVTLVTLILASIICFFVNYRFVSNDVFMFNVDSAISQFGLLYLGMLISFFSKNRFSFWKNRFFSIIEFVLRSLSNATISGVVLTYCAALTQRAYCSSEAAATQTDGTDVQIADGQTRIFQIRRRIADLCVICRVGGVDGKRPPRRQTALLNMSVLSNAVCHLSPSLP